LHVCIFFERRVFSHEGSRLESLLAPINPSIDTEFDAPERRGFLSSPVKLILGILAISGIGALAVITGNFGTVPIIDQNASIVPKDVEVSSDGTLKLFDSAGELYFHKHVSMLSI
jgi:hypothetical protein